MFKRKRQSMICPRRSVENESLRLGRSLSASPIASAFRFVTLIPWCPDSVAPPRRRGSLGVVPLETLSSVTRAGRR